MDASGDMALVYWGAGCHTSASELTTTLDGICKAFGDSQGEFRFLSVSGISVPFSPSASNTYPGGLTST